MTSTVHMLGAAWPVHMLGGMLREHWSGRDSGGPGGTPLLGLQANQERFFETRTFGPWSVVHMGWATKGCSTVQPFHFLQRFEGVRLLRDDTLMPSKMTLKRLLPL